MGWRPGGPLAIAFERTVKTFFLAMDFGAPEARYMSDMVRLSEAGRSRVHALFEALRERFSIDATIAEGAVSFGVERGEEFVPRLFAELDLPIRGVSVSRPTLDDVFMSFTGSTIRDAEEDPSKHRNRVMMQMMGGGARR